MPNIPYSSAEHAVYLTTNDDITFSFQGEPDGDFIAITYDNDAVTATEGANGDVQFSQRIASLATVVATNQWGSSSNDNMNKVFEDQQNSLYMKRIEIKRISNTENTVIASGINPKIMKVPDYNVGTVAADRAWSLKVEQFKFQEKTAPA